MIVKFLKIIEQGLVDLCECIGVKIINIVEFWNYEVICDVICYYVYGIGDDNLLWCDLEYVVKIKYGSLVVLFSFLFIIS